MYLTPEQQNDKLGTLLKEKAAAGWRRFRSSSSIDIRSYLFHAVRGSSTTLEAAAAAAAKDWMEGGGGSGNRNGKKKKRGSDLP